MDWADYGHFIPIKKKNKLQQMQYNQLKVKSLGIDTYRENIIYMRSDCHICTSEGFTALTRLMVQANGNDIVATLNVIESGLLQHDEAGLSMEAIKRLSVREGDQISIHHLKSVESIAFIRGKIYGKPFTEKQLSEIMKDIIKGRYSNVELAAFITVCSGDNLSLEEIISLTKAMIGVGHKLLWNRPIVLDKHCIGGLPGNRTTPIVVSIIAAAGYYIPKTSSRAITSPAGTADTMEVITNINLDLTTIKAVVEKENGCLAWGGAINLSPADDIIISVEKSLDLDSEGQMIASVLSKKAAAGSTHVVIDIPVGETAKVRTQEDANRLEHYFKIVGETVGLNVKTIVTNGTQPVGIGIGPSLEAMDVLSVLQNKPNAPQELKLKAVSLAGAMLDLVDSHHNMDGHKKALHILNSGAAFEKFKAICNAQGAWKEPKFAKYSFDVQSLKDGEVTNINNRQLSKLAKLAGAPTSPSAGIQFFAPLKKKIMNKDILFRIWADTKGELEYAKEYLNTIPQLITIS